MKLPPCPDSPNCVSSQVSDDSPHFIAPFKLKTSYEVGWAEIKKMLQKQSGVIMTKESSELIEAEATSLIFRFVDDVTFLIDKNESTIDIRSAARVGYSDLGVNRRRMEKFRKKLKKNNVIL